MIKSFEDWRNELREIDAQLLWLLQRRVTLAINLLEMLRTQEITLGDFDEDNLRLGLLLLSDFEKSQPPLDPAAVKKIFRRIAIETRRLLSAKKIPADSELEERLTLRELQILILIAEDHSLKNIALLLNISVKTVESHRTSIMRKLDIHSTVGLTRYAIQKGLIVP
jgi:DNA-binding CsgD family transcriptional regulator